MHDRNNPLNSIIFGLVILTLAACGIGWYLLSNPHTSSTARSPTIDSEEIADTVLPRYPLPVDPILEPEAPTMPELPTVEWDEPLEALSESLDEPPEEVQPIEPQSEPLPSLNDSDAFALAQLDAVADGMSMRDTLRDDSLLRRLALFVDNLVVGDVMRNQGPFLPATEAFPVLELNNEIYLDPEGYHRFDRLAEFLYRLDEQALAERFQQIEPLMDSAYQELGYPVGQFRIALSAAIEHLLSTPEFTQPLRLSSPSVNYEFVDANIENLSDGQKTLIRMGPNNTRKIKSLLSRFQSELN
ncbi:MAG: DUF3014 domain-containing protein [Ferrimonas sp.]